MIRRKALEREAKDAAQAALIHRRNSLHLDSSPGADQVGAILRNAADREERTSMRASERAKMPLVKRFVTR